MSEKSIEDFISNEAINSDDIFDGASDISNDEITATINAEIQKLTSKSEEKERASPAKKKVHFEPPQPQIPMIPVDECTSQLTKELEEMKEKLKAHYSEKLMEVEKQYQKERDESTKKSKFFENYKTSLISVILFLLLNISTLQSIIMKFAPKIVQNSSVLKLIYLAVVFAIIQFTVAFFA